MAEPQTVALSSTVRAVVERLGDAPCRASALIDGILDRHRSDYAGAHLALAWPGAGREASPDGWIAEIRALLDPLGHEVLHGRAVILGAALADPAAGRAVVTSGLFQALAGELSPPLATALTPAGRARIAAIPLAASIAGAQPELVSYPTRTNVVALSPSGALLALGHADGNLRVIDRRGTVHSRRDRELGVTALAFSPDGTRLATGEGSGTVTVSGPRGAPAVATLELGALVRALRFDRDGKRLAIATANGDVFGWEVATGSPPIEPADDQMAQASPDDPPPPATVSGRPVVALGHDGTRVVAGGGSEPIEVWTLGARQPESRLEPPGAIEALALAPDNRTVAAGHERGVTLFPAGGEPRLLHGSGPVGALAFSADGRRLATAARGGERHVFDLPSGGAVALPAFSGVVDLVFTPDGLRLASASEHGALLLDDVRTGARCCACRRRRPAWRWRATASASRPGRRAGGRCGSTSACDPMRRGGSPITAPTGSRPPTTSSTRSTSTRT